MVAQCAVDFSDLEICINFNYTIVTENKMLLAVTAATKLTNFFIFLSFGRVLSFIIKRLILEPSLRSAFDCPLDG